MFQFIFVFWPIVVLPIVGMFGVFTPANEHQTTMQGAGAGLVYGIIAAVILFSLFKGCKSVFAKIMHGWHN